MKAISKRLLSFLLAVILVLGLPLTAMAATHEGSAATTPTEPQQTEATVVETTVPDSTDPTQTAETTEPAATEEPDATETPTSPAVTELEATDAPTEPTEPTEPLTAEEQDLIRWAELEAQLPDPVEEYFPFAPEIKYPYGEPQDNFYPSSLFEADPYALMPMADMTAIPDEMYDNSILRALAYTGYDVQWLKDNGFLYVAEYVSSNINSYAPEVLSNIGYDDYSPFLNGDETVADASTVTGLAPDIASFESSGLVCASFASYYINNYLPNIEGYDTSHIHEAIKATTATSTGYSTASVWSWETGLTNLANTAGSGVTKYTDETTAYQNIVPGDIIVFSRDGELVHVAIYAGTYSMWNIRGTNRGEKHFIIHVGNSRGPEISTTEYLAKSGTAKESVATAWYHLELGTTVEQTGFIEVYKKDPNGNNLSGAKFKAVDQTTGDTFYIGPTDENGYAKSGELPLGTFKVTETVFPDGYEASGNTEWTVTLTEDTPNMTITIEAVNKLKTGYIEVYKKDENGSALAGATFTAVNQSTSQSYTIGPTNANGYAKSDAIPFGTYVVTESAFPEGFEASGTTEWTVTIDDDTTNRTVTVEAVNKQKVGYIEIYKEDEDGSPLAGAEFTAVNQATNASYTIGPTDANGYAKSAGIPFGTYVVTETVFPEGFEPSGTTTWNAVINDDTPDRTFTITAVNKQSSGKAKIVKTATNGGSVAGWHFEVKDSNGTLIGNYVTDETGVIVLDLTPGSYTVSETDGEYQYWVNDPNPSRTVTVKANETATVTFVNQWRGQAKIVKTATNGGSVAGWHFEVKDADGNLVGNYVTDDSGIITLDLEPGIFTVTETDGEKEYWENDANPTKTVTVKAGQTAKVTFTNKWLGKAKVIKTTTNGGSVEGWTFTIKNATGTFVGKYTTDSNGLIVADLEPGTYEIWENPVDDPYWDCDTEVKTITVKAGETASVSFQNRYIGKAKIIKTLEDPNAGTVEGWTFEVKDANGTVVGTYTTGEDGTILCELAPGQYTVTEILDDDSYWECTTDLAQMVTVTAGQTAEVTFTNRLRPAEIIAYKVDPLGAPLADAEFLLEWSEDGVNWAPVVYSDSEYVTRGGCSSVGLTDGKLVSGKDGVAHFTGLHPELQYRLTETKAPEGYHLLTGPAYEGSITPDETMTVELTVVNAPVYELPMTGSTDSTVARVLQIAGAVVLLALLLYHVKKRH